jgi:23S rRNA (uracil1939-C5)-methyltransferase
VRVIPADTAWCRGAASFFQGNRFLLGTLLETVLGHVVGDRLGDVYAGVGLFAVAAAASGREVLAIEADRHGAADLRFNARRWPRLAVERASAERLLPQVQPGVFDTLVLDPPRSGLSPEAMDAVVRLAAGRVVYVSCDVATLARDTARLRDAGYRLATVTGLDLFPNTGHVEVVAVFDRG